VEMSKIEKVESLLYQLEALKNSPEGFIYDYFEKVKRDVDLRRENLKQEVDRCSDQMIEQIEMTKFECMKLNKQVHGIETEIDNLSRELNQFRNKFTTLQANAAAYNKLETYWDSQKLQRKLDLLGFTFAKRFRGYKNSILRNKVYSFEFSDINVETDFGKIEQNEIGGKFCYLIN